MFSRGVRKEFVSFLFSADPRGISFAFHRAGRAGSKKIRPKLSLRPLRLCGELLLWFYIIPLGKRGEFNWFVDSWMVRRAALGYERACLHSPGSFKPEFSIDLEIAIL